MGDPAKWLVVAQPSGTLYAERDSHDDAVAVVERDADLIAHFGTPVIVEPTVGRLPERKED